jgi:hypothetical protein
MQFVPNTPALAGRHTLIAILRSILVLPVLEVVDVLVEVVLFILSLLDQLLHVAETQLDTLAAAVRAEGRRVGLYL